MAHKHSVYDSDNHFSINPITRTIKNESGKVTLIQFDHNSERFTFELPRIIEEHDMSLCNCVQVHFINIDTSGKNSYADVYEVNDLQISPDDENIVVLSWLISSFATQYVGSLNFIIRFACIADDGTVEYAWNTAVCSNISISSGIYNSDNVYEENSDVLMQWKNDVYSAINVLVNCEKTVDEALEKSNEALEKSNEANSKYNACVEATENANAVREEIEEGGFIESLKELNKGGKFSVWIGTQVEYEALIRKENNCLYMVTDDTTAEELNKKIVETDKRLEALTEEKNKILWEGNVQIDNTNTYVEIEIPNISKYKVIEIDGHVYTLQGIGNKYCCIDGERLNAGDGAQFLVIDIYTLHISEDNPDKVYLYYDVEQKMSPHLRNRISYNGDNMSFSPMNKFTMNKIIGIM